MDPRETVRLPYTDVFDAAAKGEVAELRRLITESLRGEDLRRQVHFRDAVRLRKPHTPRAGGGGGRGGRCPLLTVACVRGGSWRRHGRRRADGGTARPCARADPRCVCVCACACVCAAALSGQAQWTPLHWACSKGHADCVPLLLKAGADLNAKDKVRLPSPPPAHARSLSRVCSVCVCVCAWPVVACGAARPAACAAAAARSPLLVYPLALSPRGARRSDCVRARVATYVRVRVRVRVYVCVCLRGTLAVHDHGAALGVCCLPQWGYV